MIETVNKQSLDRLRAERDVLLRDLTDCRRALAAANEEIARLKSSPEPHKQVGG